MGAYASVCKSRDIEKAAHKPTRLGDEEKKPVIAQRESKLLSSRTLSASRSHQRNSMYERKIYDDDVDFAPPNITDNSSEAEPKLERKRTGLSDLFDSRQHRVLQGALSFLPVVIMHGLHRGVISSHKFLTEESKKGILVHQGEGAVVFCDASGFTALTERLAVKEEGAELLSHCLNLFMEPLIDIVFSYGGDIVKFSGDAITIVWPYDAPGDGHLSVLRASACCLELHNTLHNFDTKVPLGEGEGGNVKLTLHIGVGAGPVSILQVGGVFDRYEYVIAGPPLAQISIAEPLAKSGETVLSEDAFCWIRDDVKEGDQLERLDYHRVVAFSDKWTFSSVKATAVPTSDQCPLNPHTMTAEDIDVIRRFIPNSVFKKIEDPNGTAQANEMRVVTILFLQVSGVDVSTEKGSIIAQRLMSKLQKACYGNEGSVNKFLVDDKGLLFLCGFGLPPLIHTDDPVRAIHAAFKITKALKDLGLSGRIGVTTGKVWCGIIGSAQRKEYTFLGDDVNLSARLMGNADVNSILVCETTHRKCKKFLDFVTLNPIKVKGKTNKIPVFLPVEGEAAKRGLSVNVQRLKSMMESGIDVPWVVRSTFFGGPSPLLALGTEWFSQLQDVFENQEDEIRKGAVLQLSGGTGGGKVECGEYAIGQIVGQMGFVPVYAHLFSFGLAHKLLPLREFMEGMLETICRQREFGEKTRALLMAALTDEEVCLLRHACIGTKEEVAKVYDDVVTHEMERRMVQICIKFFKYFCDTAICSVKKDIKGVVVVLRSTHGTSYFPPPWIVSFWRLVVETAILSRERRELQMGEVAVLPVIVIVISRSVPDESFPRGTVLGLNELTDWVKSKGWRVETDLLSKDHCIQYVHLYLKVPLEAVPDALNEFCYKLAEGNSYYLREILDELVSRGLLKVQGDVLTVSDLSQVNVAEWVDTAMIATTMMSIESLKSEQAKVLKLASVFTGKTSMSDLSASVKASSEQANSEASVEGHCVLDDLHLMLTCNSLVELGMFVMDENRDYTIPSVLLQTVARGLVLKGQTLKIKKKALLGRAMLASKNNLTIKNQGEAGVTELVAQQ
ncbi:hypothetical protein CYMTET_6848 [Cymbomonas tetramitiformis]|uniref:Guanylate cyclase domain-containing protein n=1 Tax=Cymbomonas tetramitiformis TaxID=36881 RepID=A0AAE0GWL7_9CHLO|nr:hypothetical protein CYMTET_6848 [Cymbomonas tetramitiformis]